MSSKFLTFVSRYLSYTETKKQKISCNKPRRQSVVNNRLTFAEVRGRKICWLRSRFVSSHTDTVELEGV